MAIERGVLLVGSVPLADSAAVFEVLGRHLGTAATRYPDGETGVRSNWLIWQIASFKANPQLASLGTFETKGGALERFAPKPGVDQASLSFDALGYARVAVIRRRRLRSAARAGSAPGSVPASRSGRSTCRPGPR